jgi:flagellar hook protein FlgE
MIPDKVLISGTAGAPDAVYSKVKTFSISKEGLITAVLDSGKVAVLGQIATASFKNPAGLTKDGKNLYSGSSNSGDPTLRSGVGTAATNEDNSAGYGDISQGMLEMSNVDLAQQFTDMIVTSRAFQASGKMITTGDEMLQDIINLKR